MDLTALKPLQTHQSIDSVKALFEKYQDDAYMLSRIHNYLCFQLPTTMDNIKKNYDERQERIAGLTAEQDGFIERFLNTYRYFYVSATEKFVFYNGKQYTIVLEDSILHHILTTITHEKQLMDWKQRTKVYIMKRIKDTSLCKSVPESETIQTVLGYLNTLFETRQDAKYFLTILGDNILKKQHDLVHFIPAKAKAFLREVANISQLLFGTNAVYTFKHKYHDHEYTQCRVVNCMDSIETESIWGNILRNVSIDMLCVACHYSIRYGSSDDYIANFSHSDTLEQSVFYLKNNSQSQMVERFMEEYLQIDHSESASAAASTTPPTSTFFSAAMGNGTRQISWKNIQYVWRVFLKKQRLPAIIFQQDLKRIFVEKMAKFYREDTDMFVGVSSRYMPAIRAFLSFWDNMMVYDETGEYEVEELCMLYKKWALTNLPKNTPGVSLNEPQMVDLIAYYIPTAEIERSKYVYRYCCKSWDKTLDIQSALEQMRECVRDTNISVYDSYVWYCKYYSTLCGEKHPIVSKSYFEKYVEDNIGIHGDESKYLSREWLLLVDERLDPGTA